MAVFVRLDRVSVVVVVEVGDLADDDVELHVLVVGGD